MQNKRNAQIDTAFILAFWLLRHLRQLRKTVRKGLALRALLWMKAIGSCFHIRDDDER